MTTVPDYKALAIRAGTVFTPTTPIDVGDMFAGREEQLRQIVDVINQTGQHVILYGERGVGKTSLANIMSGHLLHHRVLAPRINCDASDTFDSVWRKAIEQAALTKNVGGPGFANQSTFLPLQSEELLGAVATPNAVRRCLTALAVNFLPVFVIDEFDRLDAPTRRAFADTIKSLSDHSVRATILLVGVADSVDQLLAEHQSVQRALVQVRMPRMSTVETQSLLDKGAAALGMTFHPQAGSRIVKLARGLPHYAHLLALYASRAALDNETLEVSAASVASALARALAGTQQSTLSSYETAVRSARKDNLFGAVLLACAMAETNELGEFAAQDVRRHLQNITGRKYEIPNFAKHLQEFCELKRGPVLQKSGIKRLFRYKFIDSLMQPYVIMQGIRAGSIKVTDLD